MCNHLFEYPEDKGENYNPDGKTLTGICKYCGAKQKAFGMRWSIPLEERWMEVGPCNEINERFNNSEIICYNR